MLTAPLLDKGVGELLQRMAKCEFENERGEEILVEEMDRLQGALPLPEGDDMEVAEKLMGGGRAEFQARRAETACLVLLRMSFVGLGL